jgi:trehalose synthase
MLRQVDVGVQNPDAYEEFVGHQVMDELKELAGGLRGRRILHVNSTSYGGGVSELLRSMIPLYVGLGLDVEWRVITGDERFFGVSKGFHNALQGAEYRLSEQDREIFEMYANRNAALLESAHDFVIAHDPQTLAIRRFHGRGGAKWVWRCHIDTSEPEPGLLSYLTPFMSEYDALVFTMEKFVPKTLDHPQVMVMAPGIDPLSPKNMPVPERMCHQIARWIGVDLEQPLLTQVSRFDPWKDPEGVIRVYRRAREEVPGLQLALLGSLAQDDPEGWGIYQRIREQTQEDPDIHVATNLTGVSSVEVNAFQRHSDVVIQKSIREGFGLVVSETLWKGTPVVAGPAGGIPLQMENGVGGYLAEDDDEFVERVLYLLRTPGEAARMGAVGRERVREGFLITRLMRDEMRLLASL